MRVLIINSPHHSDVGSLDLAWRAKRAGHQVKFHRQDNSKNGDGIVDVVSDFKSWLKWADLIFNADNTNYIEELEKCRKDGQCVVSCNKEVQSWELDRQIGMKVFESHGIPVPPYKLFTSLSDASLHVRSTMARYVCKPCGDISDKSLSYCSKSPEDMVYMLERWKKSGGRRYSVLLQEFKNGTEFAVGGFFGPGGFNSAFCENFEFKKLMNGDIGVATGEMGTVLRFVNRSKLADKVLLPLVKTLEKLNYIGYIDVNCIIDDKGTVWPLEFTTRPGWPTFNIQLALNKGDPVEWLLDLCQGKDSKNFLLNQIAMGVVIAIPDFPFSHLTKKEVSGVPIYGLTPSLQEHLHMASMMLHESPMEVAGKIVNVPCLCTAGDAPLIMTATGATVLGAKEKVYRKIDRLKIPNSPMYRTDIGVRLARQLPKLQKNGFARGMMYN